MDFGQRGRDRYYSEEDDQDDSNRRPSSFALPSPHHHHHHPTSSLPPSSSSTSSSSPTRWAPPAEGPEEPPGGSGPSEPPVPAAEVEKEHMFDKVVTPSDVGKLNRLVIPKQHAEKYFPLDSSTNEKGLLLNFEDRNGKPWRFRYSYWNSSQSYVMTKGWSRFVKEKRLDAGDTVSFGRGVGEAGRDRLFIDWRRRPEAQHPPTMPRLPLPNSYNPMMSFARSMVPWGRFFAPPPQPTMPNLSVYDHHRQSSYGYNAANPYLYLRSAVGGASHLGVQYGGGYSGGGSSCGGDGTAGSPIVFDSVPLAHTMTNSKRVRLFGVNLDCSPTDEDSEPLAASQVRPLPQVLSLQLSLGGAATSADDAETVESPSKDKQPMSLD